LAEQGVELIEEPLRLNSPEAAYRRLKAASPVMLIADESCHTSSDLLRCAGFFDGINVKLTKTGGLREALRLIHGARSADLTVMLGCFCGTSVSITAAGHIASLADYVDLDGSLLVKNDPYRGLEFDGNRLVLPEIPGIGARAVEVG
jgi:L-alanine-DL-glutamate epimerase-like enolase superfamily enzyme